MKISREVKVGALALLCAGILYFGFNFLKGVNIFNPSECYYGYFERSNGLTEQAPVYILGHKVGLVESIQYDFTRTPAFIVGVHINKGINLPRGTQMALIADGLLGGSAIELQLPELSNRAMPYQKGDTLPTVMVPSLFDNLQTGLLVQLDSLLLQANRLLSTLNNQMEEGNLHATLQHIEQLTADLEQSGQDIRQLTHTQLPSIINKVDTTITDVQHIANALQEAQIENTIADLNQVISTVNTSLQSEEGTIGLLLNDNTLYQNLNSALLNLDHAISNVDTIMTSIKARPFIQKKLTKKK